MILWTIQPEEVYTNIIEKGLYRCDIDRSIMGSWRKQYDWLVLQMKKRIGLPPEGVSYPVWARHTWEGVRKKPDLRRERWCNGFKGDRIACIEIDIPDDQVLLSDFDTWSIILVDGLYLMTEEEDKVIEAEYSELSEDEKWKYKSQNWENVFDIEPFKNEWMIKGESIQATFWELKAEQIRKVRFFTCASTLGKCK